MTIEDLALVFVRGIGSRGAAHLVDYFGSAEALYRASRSELVEGAGLREELAERILQREGMAEAEREVVYCRRHGVIALAATDEEYPEPLRETSDRPHVLFVRGSVEALNMRCLSMVGTREITPSGQHLCNMLVEELAKRVKDLCIVSGLAYGVDGACHRAALGCGVPTVAVVPCVLPDVKPSAHRALGEDILRKGGAIVSELHSATRQNGQLYIARNRIIAGMSMGTLVVESPAEGGSLATADMADSYGRQLMALPGRATDSSSFGSNNLIRSGKARLVLTADDIIEDMGWSATAMQQESVAEVDAVSLTAAEQLVLNAFRSHSVLDWPQLMESTAMTMGELSMVVMDMELKGLIRCLPGKRYEAV